MNSLPAAKVLILRAVCLVVQRLSHGAAFHMETKGGKLPRQLTSTAAAQDPFFLRPSRYVQPFSSIISRL